MRTSIMLVGLMTVVQVDQFSLFGHSITNLAKDALYLLISGIWDNSFPRSWSPRWVLRMGALLSNASFVTAIVPPKVASAHQGTARNASPVAISASALLATKGAPRQTTSASWRALGRENASRWSRHAYFKSPARAREDVSVAAQKKM